MSLGGNPLNQIIPKRNKTHQDFLLCANAGI